MTQQIDQLEPDYHDVNRQAGLSSVQAMELTIKAMEKLIDESEHALLQIGATTRRTYASALNPNPPASVVHHSVHGTFDQGQQSKFLFEPLNLTRSDAPNVLVGVRQFDPDQLKLLSTLLLRPTKPGPVKVDLKQFTSESLSRQVAEILTAQPDFSLALRNLRQARETARLQLQWQRIPEDKRKLVWLCLTEAEQEYLMRHLPGQLNEFAKFWSSEVRDAAEETASAVASQAE